MAADIEQHTGVRPTIKKGGRGAFEITVDGKLIFSKNAQSRFPDHREILDQLTPR
ncbi:MAG: hypothetical protein NVS3B20_10690 [Polyangiales bacterium]